MHAGRSGREGKHWVLENNIPSSDRQQDHPKDMMQVKPRLSIKDHLIMEFPNAPKSGSTNRVYNWVLFV
jgi:hypothetical protein